MQDMPGHSDEGVRDRDGGLPAAPFAEPAVHAAELGADAGAGAACRPGAFGEDDADLGASIAGPAGLVFTGGLVAPGHNRDSRPVTQVGAGTRRVLSDLSWPNSADGPLQHRRKPGPPASLQLSAVVRQRPTPQKPSRPRRQTGDRISALRRTGRVNTPGTQIPQAQHPPASTRPKPTSTAPGGFGGLTSLQKSRTQMK